MRKTTTYLVMGVLVLTSTLSGAATLGPVGWWKLDDGAGTTAVDSSPGNNHGTLMGGPQWIDGQLDGALQMDGSDDYVSLPIGPLISTLTNSTFAVWANFSNQGGAWQRIFDFGTGTTVNMFLTPRIGTNAQMRFAITGGGNTAESLITAPATLATGWHHVAVVINGDAMNMQLYLDGAVVASGTTQTVPQDLGNTNQNWLGRSQYAADGYYQGALDDFRIYDRALSQAEVQKVMEGGGYGTAGSPGPGDNGEDVPRDTVLSWSPGEFALTHDIYLGTSFADVNAASTSNPLGVSASQGQDANSYDPGRLELGQTYYWRIDEVNAAPDFTVFKGDIWSFTVEPYSYPVPGITATASSSNKDMGPEKTIDGSGLNDSGEHSTIAADMWISGKGGPQPTWIQYEFDRTYKLDRMLVWNSNQALESILGFGVQGVTIEYSADGVTWTSLGDFEFAQAPGVPAPADTTVEFGGAPVKSVKLTIASNWGGLLPQYGLSEVRFYSIPVTAREPEPTAGATDVNPQVTLSWRSGREAASHEVYLSTDQQAVIDGTAPMATVSEARYEASLDLTGTFFWKVVEVNEAETPNSWGSDAWSFSTAEFVAVDDFENYTDDEGTRIYESWVDGWTNGTGSQVGYLQAPFAERAVLHGGSQSMPFAYDNAQAPRHSETTRTFEVPQDWTQHGITTLVVYARGQSDNSPAPIYVKINDEKVLLNDGAAATAIPLWKQWNVDLASVGTNLKSVKTLTIGIGDGTAGGTGTVFIDDIRLYGTAPEITSPVDPGTAGLVALYAMEGNAQDTSGKNNHGTIMGDAGYEDGPVGQAMIFNGTNTYVELPIASSIGSWRDVTIAAYVNQTDITRLWQRAFDFGTGAMVNMFLTPNNGIDRAPRFAITTAGGGAESVVTAPAPLSTGWHHIAVVIDSADMTLQLYVDGDVAAGGPTAVLPANLGVTTQNWLGRSQYTADPYFGGSLDEFRIYTRALSASEVRYLAGDR